MSFANSRFAAASARARRFQIGDGNEALQLALGRNGHPVFQHKDRTYEKSTGVVHHNVAYALDTPLRVPDSAMTGDFPGSLEMGAFSVLEGQYAPNENRPIRELLDSVVDDTDSPLLLLLAQTDKRQNLAYRVAKDSTLTAQTSTNVLVDGLMAFDLKVDGTFVVDDTDYAVHYSPADTSILSHVELLNRTSPVTAVQINRAQVLRDVAETYRVEGFDNETDHTFTLFAGNEEVASKSVAYTATSVSFNGLYTDSGREPLLELTLTGNQMTNTTAVTVASFRAEPNVEAVQDAVLCPVLKYEATTAAEINPAHPVLVANTAFDKNLALRYHSTDEVLRLFEETSGSFSAITGGPSVAVESGTDQYTIAGITVTVNASALLSGTTNVTIVHLKGQSSGKLSITAGPMRNPYTLAVSNFSEYHESFRVHENLYPGGEGAYTLRAVYDDANVKDVYRLYDSSNNVVETYRRSHLTTTGNRVEFANYEGLTWLSYVNGAVFNASEMDVLTVTATQKTAAKGAVQAESTNSEVKGFSITDRGLYLSKGSAGETFTVTTETAADYYDLHLKDGYGSTVDSTPLLFGDTSKTVGGVTVKFQDVADKLVSPGGVLMKFTVFQASVGTFRLVQWRDGPLPGWSVVAQAFPPSNPDTEVTFQSIEGAVPLTTKLTIADTSTMRAALSNRPAFVARGHHHTEANGGSTYTLSVESLDYGTSLIHVKHGVYANHDFIPAGASDFQTDEYGLVGGAVTTPSPSSMVREVSWISAGRDLQATNVLGGVRPSLQATDADEVLRVFNDTGDLTAVFTQMRAAPGTTNLIHVDTFERGGMVLGNAADAINVLDHAQDARLPPNVRFIYATPQYPIAVRQNYLIGLPRKIVYRERDASPWSTREAYQHVAPLNVEVRTNDYVEGFFPLRAHVEPSDATQDAFRVRRLEYTNHLGVPAVVTGEDLYRGFVNGGFFAEGSMVVACRPSNTGLYNGQTQYVFRVTGFEEDYGPEGPLGVTLRPISRGERTVGVGAPFELFSWVTYSHFAQSA